MRLLRGVYVLTVCFLLVQIAVCGRKRQQSVQINTPQCLAEAKLNRHKTKFHKSSNGLRDGEKKNERQLDGYESVYKKKYETYVAKRKREDGFEKPTSAKKNISRKLKGPNENERYHSTQINVNTTKKDCIKRKYQLNCSKGWSKTENGSKKNGKVYIKRENNPLLNIDDDQEIKSENTFKSSRKEFPKKTFQPESKKYDSSSEEDSSDEW